jgi:hypothetical protein
MILSDASLIFAISMFVVALFALFEESLGSSFVLEISLFSYFKKLSGFTSSDPSPPTDVALQVIVSIVYPVFL